MKARSNNYKVHRVVSFTNNKKDLKTIKLFDNQKNINAAVKI